jgi:hypothetical protein
MRHSKALQAQRKKVVACIFGIHFVIYLYLMLINHEMLNE